ncbi:BTB/POZ domain-containing protein 6-B-like [Sitodiplosis mosellana]|uniref:BTB/POZ domain-containing protein 6-B-like n=1 Tax=Sitodiplosis mosellana TaxID=263140 RepID=UPI0024444155|nr:BTB/POZ domain-containing protein 6-B-like [Sitodiplosis mosellana]
MANILQNNAAAESTAKLYLNEKFADVHFVFDVDGEIQKIPANKLILAVLSSVFEAMFFGSLPESKEVKIVDASPGAFKEFLQFFYLDKVTLTIENVETVARLADKYDILDCVNACAAFVESQLTLDKMCWGYQLAIFLKNKKIIEFYEKNISESSKEIFASDGFRRCDEETLGNILRLNLACSETDVFNACVEWAKNACKEDGLDENQLENVKAQLGNSFKSIRFGDMSIGAFIKIHTSYKDLFTPEEFQDIILQITSTEYESKLFQQSPRSYTWDSAKVLQCDRVKATNTSRGVQSVEIVSFSSNRPVLLGEIRSASTYFNGYIYKGGFEADVAVIELEDNTFHSTVFPKILYKGSFNTWDNNQLKMVLPKPIFIKPHIIYEIHVSKIQSGYSYSATWNPEVKLKDGLKIHFHRNPSLGHDNASTGWISALIFNKV